MQASVRVVPNRREPGTTYLAILDAAEALMAEREPRVSAFPRWLAGPGVNRTTAYQRFRTREQVIAAVTSPQLCRAR